MVMRSNRLSLMVTAWLVAAAAAAQPTRDAPSAVGGLIAGVLLSDDRPSKPPRPALVLLTGFETSGDRTVVTKDDGTFAFGGLPADAYTITAKKDGYIAISWGASRPGRPGRAIALRGGESRRVTLRLPRGSVITGRISDPQGQPLAGVRLDVPPNVFCPPLGERRLSSARLPVTTDDRGTYRVFDLPAGDYLIAAHAFP